ncbi:MAG: 50S ribosomal protein L28 [Gammaproteobacteria bacterium]|jgi:large subunit ribosomal protein L28
MSQVCEVTGKRPQYGNNVSHSNRKTRRRFEPNLHVRRFWIESEKRYVTLRVSAKGLRIIDKKGIESVLADIKKRKQKDKDK